MDELLRGLWLLTATLAPVLAGYAIAVHFFRDRGVFERSAVAVMSAVAVLVVTFLVADQLRPLSATSLFVVAIAVSTGVILFVRARGTGPRVVLEQLRVELTAPRRFLLDVIETREPAALLLVPALVIGAWCVWMVLFFRSWGWDVLMFHTTITNTIVQDGSLAFMDTGFHQARGYPRNVHLLAAWNTFFLGHTALDDAPQLPFGVLGALISAAWARRLGASRSFSAAMGAAWLCFSPVFLQLPSVHVDVACAALLAAGAYFSAFSLEARDRWAAALAFGLALGTKHTGLFHLAMYAPVLLLRAGFELKASPARARLFLNQVGSAALLLLLGGHKYLQNALVMGNPAWPFIITVPGLGPLPGENDASTQYGGPPGGRASFFGIPGEFERFVFQLTEWNKAVYWPDLRDGYFGIAFTCLALPCLLLGAAALFQPGRRWAPLSLWYLVAVSVSVPSAFWPRYSMGASIAGVVGIALVWVLASRPLLRRSLSITAVGLFGFSLFLCVRELTVNVNYQWPALLRAAPAWTTLEREVVQVAPWNWPSDQRKRLDELFARGAVVTWDDSVPFPGELFTRDLRTRVVYVPSRPDLGTLVQRLRARRPRFSVVSGNGPDQLLEAAGARRLLPLSHGELWLFEWPSG